MPPLKVAKPTNGTAIVVGYCKPAKDTFVSQAVVFSVDHASVGTNWKGRSGTPVIQNCTYVAIMRATINDDEKLENIITSWLGLHRLGAELP